MTDEEKEKMMEAMEEFDKRREAGKRRVIDYKG